MLEGLLRAITEQPKDDGLWLVLADWLEKHDDPRRAELLRLHRRLLATCLEPEGHPDRDDWQARVVQLLVEGVRPCVPQRTLTLGGGVEMTFSWVPPGQLLTTNFDYDGEGDWMKQVEAGGLYLGVFPVTRKQWRAVMDDAAGPEQDDDLPVVHVSGAAAEAFCDELGRRTGQEFRLPRDIDWEHACRAGTTTEFFFGTTLPAGTANWGEACGGPTPPGRFPPNGWGLYDLHGNVREWCINTTGYPTFSERHPELLARGGSWKDDASECGSDSLFYADNVSIPHYADDFVGFRVMTWPFDHDREGGGS